jgi:hypothetical protein
MNTTKTHRSSEKLSKRAGFEISVRVSRWVRFRMTSRGRAAIIIVAAIAGVLASSCSHF